MGQQKFDLLLVEDNQEDQQMIRDALAEIEEYGPRFDWFRSEVVAVDYLADALHCLDRGRFDAVLLDLALPDSPHMLNTFSQVQLASPGMPIIGLVDASDAALAYRLLREGAQDVMIKAEIECGPLARSVRFAIERQRRSRALRAMSFFDDLTGFYSRYGFLSLAGHDFAAARAARAPITMAVLEICGLSKEGENDLLLLDIAETLQNTFSDATLIGRLDAVSFGLVMLSGGDRQFKARLDRFGQELDVISKGLRVLGATLELPEAGSCDLETLFNERPHSHKALSKTAMLAD